MATYSGTGVTSGPFTLTLNTAVTVNDPNNVGGISSTRVQIQNQSGFVCTVSNGVDVWTVGAYQATTFELSASGGLPIMVTPVTQVSFPIPAQLWVIWLLDGQSPPLADGTLQVGSSNTTNTSIHGPDTIVNTGPTSLSYTIPVPSWAVSMTFTLTQITSLNAPTITELITGNQSSTTYVNHTAVAAATYTVTFSPVGDTSLALTISSASGGAWNFTYRFTVSATGSGGTPILLFPAQPLATYAYGGIAQISATIASTLAATILTAAPTGFIYRLHLFSCSGGGATQVIFVANGTNAPFCVQLNNNPPTLLQGLLDPGPIQITPSVNTSIAYNLRYDTVSYPAIT